MDICSTRALNEQGSPCSNLTKGQREAKEWNIFKKEKKNHQTGKQLLTYRPKSSCKGKGGVGGWVETVLVGLEIIASHFSGERWEK